jgi:hypothetical protein
VSFFFSYHLARDLLISCTHAPVIIQRDLEFSTVVSYRRATVCAHVRILLCRMRASLVMSMSMSKSKSRPYAGTAESDWSEARQVRDIHGALTPIFVGSFHKRGLPCLPLRNAAPPCSSVTK